MCPTFDLYEKSMGVLEAGGEIKRRQQAEGEAIKLEYKRLNILANCKENIGVKGVKGDFGRMK